MSILPAHCVTWMETQWECPCGAVIIGDYGAFYHYTNASKEGSTTSPTFAEMADPERVPGAEVTRMEMAYD